MSIFVNDSPSHLTFLLGWRCNSSCIMCWQDVARRKGVPQPELSFFEFEALIRRYSGIKTLEFCSFGEPTLHTDFGRMIALCVVLPIQWKAISIVTNGSKLSLFPLLASLPGCTTVSIDSPDNSIYSFIRNGLNLNNILFELRKFLAFPRHPDRAIGVNMTLLNMNLHQIEEMARLCVDIGVDYLHLLRGASLEMTKAVGQGISDNDANDVIERILTIKDRCPKLSIVNWVSGSTSSGSASIIKKNGDDFCRLPWKSLDIGPDGIAHPCCRSHRINLGSAINGDPWMHQEIITLREQLENNTLDETRFCECAVCPMRYGTSGEA